jgi:hypothetical protein
VEHEDGRLYIYEMLAGQHGNTTLIDVFKMDIE